MSQHFYDSVNKLFTLMDLDHSQTIDRYEAQFSLTLVFDVVHRNNTSITTDDTEKQQIIQKQVQWLFDATHEQYAITAAEFKQCYDSLLANAYEEEVLQIDLNRAITELDTNATRLKAIALLNTAQLYYNSVTQQNDGQQILLNTVNTIQSAAAGPKQAKSIQQHIKQSIGSNTNITMQQFVDVYKYVITQQNIDLDKLTAALTPST